MRSRGWSGFPGLSYARRRSSLESSTLGRSSMTEHMMTTDPREEWLAERRKAIGASDVAAVLGVSPWATPWEVWAEKTGRLEPWSGNAATDLGTRLEPVIMDMAEAELGPIERSVRVAHATLPLAVNLDGRTADGHLPVEAKTAGMMHRTRDDWGAPG